MPLIERDYYTYREAIDLINEACPGEDALANLREALSIPFPNEVLIGWVVSQRDGRRWKIPPEAIRSKADFCLDTDTGHAQVRIRGLVQPLVVTGPIEVKRDQLDELLRQFESGIAEAKRRGVSESKLQGGETMLTSQKPRDRSHDGIELPKNRVQKDEIEKVLRLARQLWPEAKKRPEVRRMAKDLLAEHGDEISFQFEAVRKILDGSYPPSQRFDIAGL